MNTPDTEARLRVLEYEVQTLRTLLTALQGRVAELSTSTPAPLAQSASLWLFLLVSDHGESRGWQTACVICMPDLETATKWADKRGGECSITCIGEAAADIHEGLVCPPQPV